MNFTKSDILEVLNNLASSDLIGSGSKLNIHSFDKLSVSNKGKMPYIVALEGNIGAGKSTLLDHLKVFFKNSNIFSCES